MAKAPEPIEKPPRRSGKSAPSLSAVRSPIDTFYHPMTFNCAAGFLAAADAEELTRGERTLLRLKAGTALALSDTPYLALRVADIVEHAGLSYGLFYHHFKDKETAVKAVLGDLLEQVESRYCDIHSLEDDYQTIFEPNLFYIESYRRNAGLMSACLSLSENDREFGDFWNLLNDRWHRRIANGIRVSQNNETSLLPEPDAVAYGLAGMVDQSCRQIFVQKNPFAARLVETTLQMAEALSILWYRAVYGRDPEKNQVLACREKFALKRAE